MRPISDGMEASPEPVDASQDDAAATTASKSSAPPNRDPPFVALGCAVTSRTGRARRVTEPAQSMQPRMPQHHRGALHGPHVCRTVMIHHAGALPDRTTVCSSPSIIPRSEGHSRVNHPTPAPNPCTIRARTTTPTKSYPVETLGKEGHYPIERLLCRVTGGVGAFFCQHAVCGFGVSCGTSRRR